MTIVRTPAPAMFGAAIDVPDFGLRAESARRSKGLHWKLDTFLPHFIVITILVITASV